LTELRRSLGLLDATVVNVGVIVGSAVFLTASDVARAVAVAFASYWGTSCRSRRAAYLFVLGSDAVAASTLVTADTARALLGPRAPTSRRPWW